MAGAIYNGSAWPTGFSLVPTTDLKDPSLSNGTGSASGNGTHGINDAMKVGVGVGIGVGVPLLAALGAVLFLLSKERKANKQLRQNSGQIGQWGEKTGGNGYVGNEGAQGPWHEMADKDSVAKEMPASATAGRVELFGEGVAR